METDTILLRYGELALKAPSTRRRFEERLILNLKDAMQKFGAKGKVTKEWGRIFIDGGDKMAEKAAKQTFGVVSFSPAKRFEFSTLEDIKRVVAEFAKETLRDGETFGIKARRAGNHKFKSMDAAREAGAAVVEATGAKVNLTKPDKWIYLEIRDKRAYIFTEKIAGPGGLPLGIEGRVLCLISGGIDSPVAAYLMMKRGCEVDFVHFSLAPFTDRRNAERVNEVLESLKPWTNGYRPKVFYVSHGPALSMFMSAAAQDQQCILCKRMMYRVAERLAAKRKALGLVTGESLGQVASQTLPNLHVLDNAAKIPVFRPLIGMDKVEITRLAEQIGTYNSSTKPAGCCTASPRHPETDAKLEIVEDEENFVDTDTLMQAELDSVEEVTLV